MAEAEAGYGYAQRGVVDRRKRLADHFPQLRRREFRGDDHLVGQVADRFELFAFRLHAGPHAPAPQRMRTPGFAEAAHQ